MRPKFSGARMTRRRPAAKPPSIKPCGAPCGPHSLNVTLFKRIIGREPLGTSHGFSFENCRIRVGAFLRFAFAFNSRHGRRRGAARQGRWGLARWIERRWRRPLPRHSLRRPAHRRLALAGAGFGSSLDRRPRRDAFCGQVFSRRRRRWGAHAQRGLSLRRRLCA
jgi:hypothetical protein